MTLSSRLLAGSLLVIAALVAIIVTLSGVRLRTALREQSVRQLHREAQLVASQWTPDADPESLAARAGNALGHRVTLIGPDGRVIGDSEFDEPALSRLQNHATRPEVVAASRRGMGWSRRASPSAGDEELYVAVRARPGIARVSLGTSELDAIVWREQRDVLVSGLIGIVLAAGLTIVFSRKVTRPVVELRDVAQALAAGDLSRRPALSAPGEIGDLAAAVHRMAEQLDSRLRAMEADDALLEATIESLNEGVVVVDDRRRVIRVNAAGRRLLALREAVPFTADRLPRDRALREALAAALGGQNVEGTELTLGGEDGSPRTVALQARALARGGAVLALYDLTAMRRLETVRRDFVANVSHELRTPLAVIAGFAETLRDEQLAPEDR
ncbi:MAG TPA: HAMP domain-containing protein, partial [Gemmatimonadaceae bacterium]|nr:HAMP domain-containing protein [Gemmatimonadaceae bacterium]